MFSRISAKLSGLLIISTLSSCSLLSPLMGPLSHPDVSKDTPHATLISESGILVHKVNNANIQSLFPPPTIPRKKVLVPTGQLKIFISVTNNYGPMTVMRTKNIDLVAKAGCEYMIDEFSPEPAPSAPSYCK